MARRPAAPDPGFTIETLINNTTVKVTRTTMQPGAQMPQQGRGFDYVILPVTEFACTRVFSQAGTVRRRVSVEGAPGKPYFVRASGTGGEFALHNESDKVIVFDKVVIKRPKAASAS